MSRKRIEANSIFRNMQPVTRRQSQRLSMSLQAVDCRRWNSKFFNVSYSICRGHSFNVWRI